MKHILFILLILGLSLEAKSYIISGGKNNVVQIIASKILIIAYKRAGHDMHPIFLPLEQSLKLSNSGKSDGEMARIKKSLILILT